MEFNLRHYFEQLNLLEAAYDHQVAALHKAFPEKSNEIDSYLQSAKAILKKSDRISYYLSVLKSSYEGTIQSIAGSYKFSTFDTFSTDMFDFYSREIPQIEQVVLTSPLKQPIGDLFNTLGDISSKYSASDKPPVKTGEGDRQIIQFPDGASWWYVNRAYCSEEGRSGKHCGNIAGKLHVNQRILSLRNAKNQVILTFVYMPNGHLGEMKAKGNQKPRPEHHHYIIQLLLNKVLPIKGIDEAIWGAEFNFSIFDLSKENIKVLIENGRSNLVASQIHATPIEFLKAPDYIKSNTGAQKIAIQAMPELEHLIGHEDSPRAWNAALQTNPRLIAYAPPTIGNYESRLLTTLMRDPRILMQCGDSITSNYNLMQEIILSNPDNVVYVVPASKHYEKLWQLAIKEKPVLVTNLAAPDKIKNDKSAWLTAINNDFSLLFSNNTPDSIRADSQIWQSLINAQPLLMQRPDLPANVKSNIQLWQYAIQKSPKLLFSDKTPAEIRRNSTIWQELIKTTPEMITHASVPAEVKADLNLWKIAIADNPSIITINSVPPEIKNNATLWQIAVRADPRLQLRMPANLRAQTAE